MNTPAQQKLDREFYTRLCEDPELNAKVRKVTQLLRENELTPVHAVFAVALAHKTAEKGCPCGSADVHRINALDEVCMMFLDAYDSAVVPAGQG